MFNRIALLNILLLALAAVGSTQSASQKESAPKGKQPAGKTKAWKVQNAMSAAPRAIAKNATIVDQPGKEGGEMPVLRKGMNDWTCMPDDPSTPANDPMCLDKNAVDWAKAWKSHTEPKLSGAGMGYMLQGGGSPSNTDPFATKPAEGKKWHTRCFGKTVSRLILATSAAMSGTRPQRSIIKESSSALPIRPLASPELLKPSSGPKPMA